MQSRLVTFGAAALIAIAAAAARAAPTTYTIAFDGSVAGGRGVGSFVMDPTLAFGDIRVTGFTWDFGGGNDGGVTDAAMAQPTVSGGFADFIVLDNQGHHMVEFDYGIAHGGYGAFSLAIFCLNTVNSNGYTSLCPENRPGQIDRSYYFRDATGKTVESGYYTITAVGAAVPEPGTEALAALGLAGLAGYRCRLRRRPSP